MQYSSHFNPTSVRERRAHNLELNYLIFLLCTMYVYIMCAFKKLARRESLCARMYHMYGVPLVCTYMYESLVRVKVVW